MLIKLAVSLEKAGSFFLKTKIPMNIGIRGFFRREVYFFRTV